MEESRWQVNKAEDKRKGFRVVSSGALMPIYHFRRGEERRRRNRQIRQR